MDRQAHELTILSLLAVLGMIVASMRDDLTFVAVFLAQAGIAFASLVWCAGSSKGGTSGQADPLVFIRSLLRHHSAASRFHHYPGGVTRKPNPGLTGGR